MLDIRPPIVTRTPGPTAGKQKVLLNLRNVSMLLIFAFTCYPFRLTPPVVEPPRPVQGSADLYNFDQVHSYLYRGGAPSAAGLLKLKELGVKTIIDFRMSKQMINAEAELAQGMGMRHISLPTKFFPSAKTIETFFATADAASTDPEQGPIFIHCAHGSDRTGFMVAIWRVTRDGWSCAQATAEMLGHGFMVHRLPIVGQPKETF